MDVTAAQDLDLGGAADEIDQCLGRRERYPVEPRDADGRRRVMEKNRNYPGTPLLTARG